MKSLLQVTVTLVHWAAAQFGVLQTEQLLHRENEAHSNCRPWGCGPPTSALIAWHGFWLVLAIPPSIVLRRTMSPRRLRIVGLLFITVATFSLIALALREAAT